MSIVEVLSPCGQNLDEIPPGLELVAKTAEVIKRAEKEGSSALSLDPAVQKRIDDVAEAWAAPFLRGRQLTSHGSTL